MRRQWNNSRKCIDCGSLVPRKVSRCQPCNQKFLKVRPTYPRTDAHRQRMTAATAGMPKLYATGGSLPGVAEKIRKAWTPAKREAARLRGLKFAESPEWRMRIAMSLAGELNPRWEDGRAV